MSRAFPTVSGKRQGARICQDRFGLTRTAIHVNLAYGEQHGWVRMHHQIIRFVAVASVCCSALSATPARADILPDAPLDKVFEGLREDVETIVRKSEESGSRLIAQLGRAALDLIDAAGNSAGNLIDQTFSNLDASLRNSFNEIDELATRIEEGHEVLMKDAILLSAIWFDAIGRVPLVEQRFEVYAHSPRTIAPNGIPRIELRVVGPGIGAANPDASIKDTPLDIEIPNRNTVHIILDRRKFAFTGQPDRTATVVMTFDERPRGFFQSSPERIERDLSLWLLPTWAARWDLVQTVLDERVERDGRRTNVTATGRDKLMGPWAELRDDDLAAGWEIDLEMLGRMVDFVAAGGENLLFGGYDHDSVACVGPNMRRAQKDRVEFHMQMGSVEGQAASGSCWINLPLIRTVTFERTLSEYQRPPLTWDSARRLEIFDTTTTWTLVLDLYDGTRELVTDGTPVPPMDVEVEKGGSHLLLRARLPADF